MFVDNQYKDKFSLFRSKENLDKFLRILIAETKIKIGRILILGAILGKELEILFKLFPESHFFITDKSKIILNSIIKKYKIFKNFSTYVVDAFDGSSLLDFILKHGKFDLVIASGLNVYSPNKKQLLHLYQFIYKHYLKKYGIYCIIIKEEDTWFIVHKVLQFYP